MSISVAVRTGPGILYISYDGMLEPLGQSQVVGYLEKLAPIEEQCRNLRLIERKIAASRG